MRKAFVAVAVLAISALATGVAAPAGMPGTAAVKPLRMTVGTLGSIGSLDPRHGNSQIAREVWNLQYPTLTSLDPVTLDPTAGIADAWSPLPGGRGWRYSLRTNQAWSDGKPVTADDVAYSLERARDEHWPYAGSMLHFLAAHIVNRHTIDVTSSQPHPPPGLLLHIVPAHVFSKSPDLGSNPADLGIADGAWHVVSTAADSVQLNVLGRPAGPPLDQIVFRTYPNAESLIAALAHRDVDVISGLPDSDIGRLESMSKVTVDHAADGTEYVLRFESFPAGRLRRVVSLAIDRTQLVADAVHGVGTAPPIDARPEEARKDLLALDPRHDLAPTLAIPTDATGRRVGVLVQRALAAIGLTTHSPRRGAAVGLVVERVSVASRPLDTIALFDPDTLQAFRIDNVSGFLREPSQRSLVVFGPTVAPYGDIVAAQPPVQEQLSNKAYAIGAAVILVLCGLGYWIASRVRKRFAA